MKRLISVLAIALLCSAPIVGAQPDTEWERQAARMQQRMETMQQQMERIRQTQDAKERDRLMREHWQTMREQMKDMRGMGGEMMGRAHGRRDAAGAGGMRRMDPAQREQFMQDRMDMMQMMMEHMMERHEMMEDAARRRR